MLGQHTRLVGWLVGCLVGGSGCNAKSVEKKSKKEEKKRKIQRKKYWTTHMFRALSKASSATSTPDQQ
uniref:Putative secreted protein n=1 Tax=Anopheles darlingi TaxID=43151 RepID=A0A2M4D1V9_ANODA